MAGVVSFFHPTVVITHIHESASLCMCMNARINRKTVNCYCYRYCYSRTRTAGTFKRRDIVGGVFRTIRLFDGNG